MKIILFLVLIASLAMAQKPALQKGRQVLLDFRVDRNAAAPKISAATERNVLSKVFRRYLTDQNKCKSDLDMSGGIDHLTAARRAGQMVPSISNMTTGSFTAPGQAQTLYVIYVNECDATHAENYGSKRVAIFSGQQLIADIDVDFKQQIVRKTDLNSDGIDELLMTAGDMGQGTLIEIAALLSFQNGRLRVVHDFETVVEDSCASGFPGSSSRASVLYISDVLPGAMPKLTKDNYASSCSKTKRWKLFSEKRSN